MYKVDKEDIGGNFYINFVNRLYAGPHEKWCATLSTVEPRRVRAMVYGPTRDDVRAKIIVRGQQKGLL